MKIELNQALVDQTRDALIATGVVEDLSKADEEQRGTDRRWAKVAAKFYSAGIRKANLVGASRVREAVKAAHEVIIASWPKRHQELLALRGPAVTELSDSDQGLRSKRQGNIGTYTSLIARHLGNLEGPRERGTKKASAADKAPEAAAMPTTWAAALPVLVHLSSTAPTMPVGEGQPHMGALDIAAVQDALADIVARIRRNAK